MTVSVSNKIKELKEPVVLQGFTAQEKKRVDINTATK